ncbi:uncharacterized protein SCHCODRAFT_01170394 [Schizophyllum commune H4-8]|nr:uncharacterized protein SCHCODRAFT_01170394 [Schizophyllum commune H4-8]KAI5896205.1 hypothetical protein SCHCODRAFT_01170394 [Schizophyllum commune H4-8]
MSSSRLNLDFATSYHCISDRATACSTPAFPQDTSCITPAPLPFLPHLRRSSSSSGTNPPFDASSLLTRSSSRLKPGSWNPAAAFAAMSNKSTKPSAARASWRDVVANERVAAALDEVRETARPAGRANACTKQAITRIESAEPFALEPVEQMFDADVRAKAAEERIGEAEEPARQPEDITLQVQDTDRQRNDVIRHLEEFKDQLKSRSSRPSLALSLQTRRHHNPAGRRRSNSILPRTTATASRPPHATVLTRLQVAPPSMRPTCRLTAGRQFTRPAFPEALMVVQLQCITYVLYRCVERLLRSICVYEEIMPMILEANRQYFLTFEGSTYLLDDLSRSAETCRAPSKPLRILWPPSKILATLRVRQSYLKDLAKSTAQNQGSMLPSMISRPSPRALQPYHHGPTTAGRLDISDSASPTKTPLLATLRGECQVRRNRSSRSSIFPAAELGRPPASRAAATTVAHLVHCATSTTTGRHSTPRGVGMAAEAIGVPASTMATRVIACGGKLA